MRQQPCTMSKKMKRNRKKDTSSTMETLLKKNNPLFKKAQKKVLSKVQSKVINKAHPQKINSRKK